MIFIFLRSLIYNVLFYAVLVFWLLVAIPTVVMRRFAERVPAPPPAPVLSERGRQALDRLRAERATR